MATKTTQQSTELGFVEKVDSWRLLSHYFPSKVGGKPAWLSLQFIPTVDDLKCRLCQGICIFLMQVYANLDVKEDCFHRSFFVFICRNPKCLQMDFSQSIFAYRSQLPRINTFYSSEPPSEGALAEVYPKAEDYQKLCTVCGCAGSKTCSKCHRVSYCSKEHQAVDWKAYHKKECGKDTDSKGLRELSDLLFPEFELVTEPEEYEDSEEEEKSEDQKQAEYQEYLKKTEPAESGAAENLPEKELEKMAATVNDEAFENFQQRIKHEPEQVVRYSRGGTPLWVSSQSADPDIPQCQCGAPRQFEFQIMPQLLNYLGVDSVEESLDWGTLIVYTCRDSCSTGDHYVKEYVLKQDFSKVDAVNTKK